MNLPGGWQRFRLAVGLKIVADMESGPGLGTIESDMAGQLGCDSQAGKDHVAI